MARLGRKQRERARAKALRAPFVAPVAALAPYASLDTARADRIRRAYHAEAKANYAAAPRAPQSAPEPIVRARPLSNTPAACDFAPKVQRPSYRFHDPKGNLLKSRVIGLKPKQTKARFSQPALAPVTPAQFAALQTRDSVRQYSHVAGIALRQSARDAKGAEKEFLAAVERARQAKETTLIACVAIGAFFASITPPLGNVPRLANKRGLTALGAMPSDLVTS